MNVRSTDQPEKAPRDEYDQPLPTGSEDYPNMQDLVIDDIKLRLQIGIQRYGQGLKPFNGRDMLKDLYDELLDAAVYIRGAMYERDGK